MANEEPKMYGFYGSTHNLASWRKVLGPVMGWDIQQTDKEDKPLPEDTQFAETHIVHIELTREEAQMVRKLLEGSPFNKAILFFRHVAGEYTEGLRLNVKVVELPSSNPENN